MGIKRTLLSLLVLFLVFGLTACKPEEQEPPTLDTRYTDELKLQANFTGKEFIKDGIGEVELVRVVDGDTIHVRTNNQNISIRF